MGLGTIFMLAAGALLTVWPQSVASIYARRRTDRLDQLRGGAPEEHFEERRELDVYSWRGRSATWRILGILLLLVALLNVLPYDNPATYLGP